MSDLIQVIDTLTPKECEDVLSSIQPDWYVPTTIFGMSGAEVNTGVRSNTRACLDDSSIAAKIMHKGMNEALLEYRRQLVNIHDYFSKYPTPGSWRTNCYREQIQVLKYETTQHYTWHHDEATDKKLNEYHRTISIVLYLTDDFTGGRTCFPHRCFKPRAGQALVFPSNWCFPHQSEPVTSGTKIAAVTWYHSHYDFSEDYGRN